MHAVCHSDCIFDALLYGKITLFTNFRIITAIFFYYFYGSWYRKQVTLTGNSPNLQNCAIIPFVFQLLAFYRLVMGSNAVDVIVTAVT